MKKWITVLLAMVLCLGLFVGCAPTEKGPAPTAAVTTFRIASLKGPTTMGMVKLMKDAEDASVKHDYQFEMYGTADEIIPKLVNGELDVALLPCNVASILYNRTEGAVQVAAINTLGVLYVVESGDTVHSIRDLAGKTIYSTGKGTTPEFVLNYILNANGIDPEKDITIEYKSEATEIAAILKDAENAIAVLPQPYVTVVQMQNDKIRVALSLTEEWDKVSTESSMVTGVVLVRKAFAEKNPLAFREFLDEYKASTEYVNAHVEEAAAWVESYGIVAKAPIAVKAIPACNITYIDGDDMKDKVSGYLEVLFNANPKSVGGTLPKDDFYFIR
ncbi:MAG: ABC transporter substrate-binding protein [Chloroflexi bacterium]|nr:ABC transporter substrate-binding protein [Chloroflexota bacterium]